MSEQQTVEFEWDYKGRLARMNFNFRALHVLALSPCSSPASPPSLPPSVPSQRWDNDSQQQAGGRKLAALSPHSETPKAIMAQLLLPPIYLWTHTNTHIQSYCTNRAQSGYTVPLILQKRNLFHRSVECFIIQKWFDTSSLLIWKTDRCLGCITDSDQGTILKRCSVNLASFRGIEMQRKRQKIEESDTCKLFSRKCFICFPHFLVEDPLRWLNQGNDGVSGDT